jgi:hypothetical protein
MGRPPCCDKEGIKKGPWTPEEDILLVSYIQEHGPGNWRAVPTNTGYISFFSIFQQQHILAVYCFVWFINRENAHKRCIFFVCFFLFLGFFNEVYG